MGVNLIIDQPRHKVWFKTYFVLTLILTWFRSKHYNWVHEMQTCYLPNLVNTIDNVILTNSEMETPIKVYW